MLYQRSPPARLILTAVFAGIGLTITLLLLGTIETREWRLMNDN